MRYVEVDAGETGRWRAALAERGWLAKARIRDEGATRLIPLADEAPPVLPEPFAALPVRSQDDPSGSPRTWVDHLRDVLPPAIVEQHIDDWTSPHDLLGDLVITKLHDAVRPYEQAVGVALLRYRAGSRLALADDGVQGEMRVRALRPLAVRVGEEVRPVAPGNPPALLSTRTRVREHGLGLEVDPAAAYYSPRLANERLGTLDAARRLRARLGRPLRVVDPYAGVGPALVPLLRVPGLVGRVLASDLNDAAVPLLSENVRRHAARARPRPRTEVLCADARRLAPTRPGAFDLLLVNLPHDSVDHLPDLLPLLATGAPTLVRGWAIVAYDALAATQARLDALLRPLLPGSPPPELVTVRTYSAFQAFARFEAWLLREE